MTAVATTPMSDRRAATTAALLVAAVVVIIGFGSGIGSVLSRGSGAAASTPGRNLGTGVQSSGPLVTGATTPHATTTSSSTHGGTTSADAMGNAMGASTPNATAPTGDHSTVATASAATASTASCAGTDVIASMLEPFMTHLDKAHLETSPGDQAGQALDVDQYVKTHTVLLEQMLAPVVNVVLSMPDAIGPFMTHLDKAHLETSPGDQIAQLLDVDQYVKTHTVLVEDMVAPTMAAITQGCRAGS